MSKKFNMVKKWWETFHIKEMIRNAVIKEFITKEEYETITGENYE